MRRSSNMNTRNRSLNAQTQTRKFPWVLHKIAIKEEQGKGRSTSLTLPPILPPPPPIILNRNPRPLLPKAPPRILIPTPTPAPLSASTPILLVVIALAGRRLHISIMIISRLGAMLSLAPILALPVHILASRGARRPARHARARRHFGVVRAAGMTVTVMARRRGRCWHGHGHWRGRWLYEDGDGLRCWNREGFGRGHRDVRC